MKRAGALLATLGLLGLSTGLAGCMPPPPPAPQLACPTGQEARRTAELFFGRNGVDQPVVSEADFRAFVDRELARRFPEGLTVMDGGDRWRGDENKLIREASKVVLIILPKSRDAQGRVEAARAAYRSRFHQETLLVLNQPSCVSF